MEGLGWPGRLAGRREGVSDEVFVLGEEERV